MIDDRSYERAKRDHILLHLIQAKGKMIDATKSLKVTRMTLYRLIKRFAIEKSEYQKPVANNVTGD